MTDKAYIVANKKQELDMLNKFERDGLVWFGGENPTDWITSETNMFNHFVSFPYALLENEKIAWISMVKLTDEEIVYDGRKEEKMYKVTQEFMDELVKWRDDVDLDAKSGDISSFVYWNDIQNIPNVVDTWWTGKDDPIENNNRLIAIIQWLNGEDVFEVEEPHKFVVRSDKTNRYGDYTYIVIEDDTTSTSYTLKFATEFDTREEAQEWANSHQVVVEIDEDGN